jgi:hypothetical protein
MEMSDDLTTGLMGFGEGDEPPDGIRERVLADPRRFGIEVDNPPSPERWKQDPCFPYRPEEAETFRAICNCETPQGFTTGFRRVVELRRHTIIHSLGFRAAFYLGRCPSCRSLIWTWTMLPRAENQK